MSPHELRQEIARLKEKARKAEQMGIINEYAVLERKAAMAKAYLLDPADFIPGEIYEIEGSPGAYFKIEYFGRRHGLGIPPRRRKEARGLAYFHVEKTAENRQLILPAAGQASLTHERPQAGEARIYSLETVPPVISRS